VALDGGAPVKIPFEAEVKLEVGPEVRFAYRVDTAAMVTARQIRNRWCRRTGGGSPSPPSTGCG
jgi:hypothetical protein